MTISKFTRRRPAGGKIQCQRRGVILVLFAIMLALLIGMLGLVIDGGLLLAGHERAQNIADTTARSCAIALHNGADSESLQATGELFAFTHNKLPEDPEMSRADQVIVNHPPVSGPYAGSSDYVEVIVTHPMDAHFIQVLGVEPHQRVAARAVAGFRVMPKDAGLVILDPRGNPGLAVSGSNAVLDVDSATIVYTRREGENEFGATVGEYHAGQPSVTVDGSGATMVATELNVSGGVDDWENYVAPDIGALHAGTNNPVHDPLHTEGSLVPVPTLHNGVLNREMGSVGVTNNNQSGLDDTINQHDPVTGVTTLYPGIYNDINISGGNVIFKEGIYVLKKLSGGGNILSVTGGTVSGRGVMFYNTGNTWDADTGGHDQGDIAYSSETDPIGVSATKFGGIDVHGEGVHFSPIDTTDPSFNYTGMGGIEAFNQLVIYQRRFNTVPINITNGQPAPLGISGRFYAKWANLHLSGQGTYNFSIIVGSMSVSGRAIVTVRDRIPLDPVIEPVRLVE